MSCSPQLSPAAARAAARNCHSSETQQPDKQSASGLQPASVDGRIPDNRTSKSQNASWMYHDIYIPQSLQLLMAYYIHIHIIYIYICDYVGVRVYSLSYKSSWSYQAQSALVSRRGIDYSRCAAFTMESSKRFCFDMWNGQLKWKMCLDHRKRSKNT